MTTITHLSQQVQYLLGPRADQLAKETGFVKHRRKISGADFVQGLVFGLLANADHSKEEWASILGRRGVQISASGLCQRFTQEAVQLLQRLLEEAVALGIQAQQPASVNMLDGIEAVIIEDSTTIRLPSQLANLWPSCGGGQGQSQTGLKIHVRWDLKKGGLQGLVLSPSRVADQSSSLRQQGIAAGVLNIADEGYCSLQWLREQSGMFLGRPRLTVGFLEPGSQQVLDPEEIGPQVVGQWVDRQVLVGKEASVFARRRNAVGTPRPMHKRWRERNGPF